MHIPNAQVLKEGAVKETKQVPTKEVTAMDTATNKDEKEVVQIPLANGNIPDTQDANKERSDDAQEVPAKDTTPKKDGKESVEEKKPEEASVTPLTATQESTILEPKPQSVFMTIEQTLEYNKPVGPGIQPGERRFIIPVMDYKAAIYRNKESEIAPKTENEPEKPLSEIVLDVSAANDQFFVPEGTKPVIDTTKSTIPKIRAAGGNLRHLQLRIKRFRNKITPT